MASVHVTNAKGCLLWYDLWNGNVSQLQHPELHSFAKNKTISLCNAQGTPDIYELFSLPLSVEAHQQLQDLQLELASLDLNDQNDKWECIWGSAHFSSSKAYKNMTGHSQVDLIYKTLWKSSCQGKHKIFFWLALKDRLSTRNMIRKRGMHLDNYQYNVFSASKHQRKQLCICCSIALLPETVGGWSAFIFLIPYLYHKFLRFGKQISWSNFLWLYSSSGAGPFGWLGMMLSSKLLPQHFKPAKDTFLMKPPCCYSGLKLQFSLS